MENTLVRTRSASIIAIIALGVLLRVGALLLLAEYPLLSDALAYHETAEMVTNGGGYDVFWPPGLPYVLNIVYSVFGASEFAGRAAMILFYVLLAVGLYLLVREVLNERAANLTVLFFTLYPNYIYHSVTPLTHLPVAAYLVWAVYVTYKLTTRPDPAKMLLLGLTLGMMILTRAGSLTVLGFVALYLLWRVRRLLPVVVPVVVALVLVGSYLVRIYQVDNHFIFINYANSFNLFVGNNPDTPLYRTWLFASDVNARTEDFNLTNWYIINTPPYQQDQQYRQEAIDHILDRPDLFALRTVNRVRAYFGFDTFAGARLVEEGIGGTLVGLAVIAVDGLFYLTVMTLALLYFFVRKPVVPVVLVGGVALFYALPYFIAFSHATYHFPTVPLFAVLAVGTLAQGDLRALLRRRVVWWALAIFVVIQVEWALVMAGELLA